MEYICHENALWSEGTQKVLVQGSKRYIVMYQIQDDTLNIKEVLPKTEDKTWLYALMQKNHCTKAVITWQPPVMCNRKLDCKDDLQSEKGYFNLTMG